MKRPPLFLSAALLLSVAAPVHSARSAQPPVSRTVPARAIEASIDAQMAQHPKSKASAANAKTAKAKASASTDVVTSVKPTAPRPEMRRQPKPARRGSRTP
jgi:hypothetical protein